MTREEMLQIQACLDGELSEADRRACEDRCARDPEARALLEELRHVRDALRHFDESAIRLPESREFYWSKIARAIERAESGPAVVRGGSWVEVLRAWRRWLAPVAVLGALALAVTLRQPDSAPSDYPELHLTLADSAATTYRDDARGLTLVWFTWPAEE